MLQLLWRTAHEASFVRESLFKTRFLGTGDGFFLVVPGSNEDLAYDLYDFAKEFVEALAKNKVFVRCALHAGPIEVVELPELSREELGGEGLNQCARAVEYADSEQVLITEAFRQALHNVWDEIESDFYPSEANDPYRIVVKHGVSLTARVNSKLRSKKLLEHQVVREILHDECLEVAYQARNVLSRHYANVHVRSTIFVPRKGKEGTLQLRCTEFRHSSRTPASLPASHTRYLLDPNEKRGMSAAFFSGNAKIVLSLPDSEEGESEYAATIEALWGTPVDTVLAWGVKPRSIFAIPIHLAEPGSSPLLTKTDRIRVEEVSRLGVLCLDADETLDNVAEDALLDLVRLVHDRCTSRIAPLLKLYQST